MKIYHGLWGMFVMKFHNVVAILHLKATDKHFEVTIMEIIVLGTIFALLGLIAAGEYSIK